MKVRTETIDKILAACYGAMDLLMSDTKCPLFFREDEERVACQQMRLGGLFYVLKNMGIWPPKVSSSEVRCSVSDLIKAWTLGEQFALVHVPKYAFGQSLAATKPAFSFVSSATAAGIPGHNVHESCSLKQRVQNALNNIAMSIPSPVQESHLRHMKERSDDRYE